MGCTGGSQKLKEGNLQQAQEGGGGGESKAWEGREVGRRQGVQKCRIRSWAGGRQKKLGFREDLGMGLGEIMRSLCRPIPWPHRLWQETGLRA